MVSCEEFSGFEEASMPSTIRLLLVDQDTLLLDILEHLFDEHGYRTVCATSLPDAIVQLDRAAFHLVISHVLDTVPLKTFHITQSLQHHASPSPTGLLTGWNVPA